MADLILPHAPVDTPDDGLPIGDAAAACGITPDTLRRTASLPAHDLAWVASLVMLRETGMPISEIRKMAQPCRQPGTDSERLALLELHGDRVIAEQQRIARHLVAIENKIAFYRAALPYGVSVSRCQRVARDVSALGFWSSPCRPIGVRLVGLA